MTCIGGTLWFCAFAVSVLAFTTILALFMAIFDKSEEDNLEGVLSVEVFRDSSFHASLLVSIGICLPILAHSIVDIITYVSSEKFTTNKIEVDVGFVSQLIILSAILAPDIIIMYKQDSDNMVSLYWFLVHVQSLALTSVVICLAGRFSNDAYSLKAPILASVFLGALHVVHYCSIYAQEGEELHYQGVLAALASLSYATVGYICYRSLYKFMTDNKNSLITPDNLCGVAYIIVLLLWLTGFFAFYVLTQNNHILDSTSPSEFCVGHTSLLTGFAFVLMVIYGRKPKYAAFLSENALEMKSIFVRHVSHEIRTPLNTTMMALNLLDKELRANVGNVLQSSTSTHNLYGPNNNNNNSSSSSCLPLSMLGSSSPSSPRENLDSLTDLIRDITTSCATAVEILNDLLLYEKIDGKLVSLEATEQNVWEMVTEVLRVFRIQAKSSQIEIVWPENPLEGVVNKIDRYKLAQVMRNLVSNALKFSKAGSTVKVTAKVVRNHAQHGERKSSMEGGTTVPSGVPGAPGTPMQSPTHGTGRKSYTSSYGVSGSPKARSLRSQVFPTQEMVRISVIDTGIGMSKENQKRLFHEIVQFDAVKHQKGGGSGLGLWISNSIVKLHGGHIGVHSEGEGHGSTYYFDVPIIRIDQPVPVDEGQGDVENGEEQSQQAHSPANLSSYSANFLKMLSHSDDSSPRTTARIFNGMPGIMIKNHRSSSKTVSTTASSMSGGGSSLRSGAGSGVQQAPAGAKESPTYRARLEAISGAGEGDGDPVCEVSTAVIETFTPAKKGSNSSNESQKSQASGHSLVGDKNHVHPSVDPRRYYHKSVLIVDDSRTNRKLVNRLLRDKMGTRDEAVDGRDALNKVKDGLSLNFRYDVILMDQSMPEMDGLTATREIRALGFTGIIIGVTGNGHESDIAAFKAAGADMVVIKPLDADAFWTAVCDLLASGSDSPNQV